MLVVEHLGNRPDTLEIRNLDGRVAIGVLSPDIAILSHLDAAWTAAEEELNRVKVLIANNARLFPVGKVQLIIFAPRPTPGQPSRFSDDVIKIQDWLDANFGFPPMYKLYTNVATTAHELLIEHRVQDMTREPRGEDKIWKVWLESLPVYDMERNPVIIDQGALLEVLAVGPI